MDRRGDLAFAIIVTVFGVLLFAVTSIQELGPQFDPLGKRGLPYAVAVFLIVVGGVLVARRLRTWRSEVSNLVYDEGSEDEPGHPASALRAFAVMGLTIGYAVLLPDSALGFLIATPIYIVVGFYVMRLRSPLVLAVIPVAFTLIVFFTFNNILSVPLPVGPLNDLLVDLGWIEAIR